MTRYKDIELLDCMVLSNKSDEFCDGVSFALEQVDKLPTVDVEEITYCKDCQWATERMEDNELFKYQCCNTIACGKPRRAIDFCSYGERRDTK